MKPYDQMDRDELQRELARRDEQLAGALRRNEERYRSLFMSMSEGFFLSEIVYDGDGVPRDYRYLDVNPAFERLIGRCRDEMIGRTIKELIPNFSPLWLQIVVQQASDGGPCHYCQHSDALDKDFEIIAFRPSEHQFAALVTEITEHKRAELALRESQARLRLFIEHAPASLAMFDRDMRYLCASRRWLELHGLISRELAGLCHYDVIPGMPEEWRQAHRRGLSGEFVESAGDRYVLGNGTVLWASWKVCPWYDRAGAVGGIVIFTEDISTLKQAEDALRESEQRYRDIVENQTEFVDRYLPGGILTFVNNSLARISGLPPEELIGKSFYPFLPEKDREQVIRTIESLSADNPIAVMENRVELADGIHWMQWKHCALTDEAGDIVEYQATGRDITELKRMQDDLLKNQDDLRLAKELLEQRVRERTADLEAAIKAQESFSYSVSHDLRAPLRHINSFSAMIMEEHDETLPAPVREYLQRICAASSRMGALIDNLLELSRVTRAQIDPGIVDLSELATTALRMFQETDPGRKAEVVVEPGITVMGDRLLLQQLLENLLGNAWKYTLKKPRARIQFGKALVCGLETYFVRDNGAGFDMTYKEKLFNAFERLHGAEFEGIGIGLATAQHIIQRHGGRIWGEGKVDQGATFYFTLPVYF